jgi:hypothetical protein
MNVVWQPLLHPVFLIVVLILLSTFFLILAAIRGWDKGSVLLSMSKIEFARGLITYLFAVVTIGTAVVLLVYVLTTPAPNPANREASQAFDQTFQHGKEILSLLLGVFGAIVGFYFGSEVSKGREDKSLKLAPLRLTGVPAVAGRAITVNTVVSGGKPPWRHAVVIGDVNADPVEDVDPGGWIVKEVLVPPIDKETNLPVRVLVRDEDDHLRERRVNVRVSPPA